MRKFQELVIRGPYEKLRRLPDEIEKRLTDGWSRKATLRDPRDPSTEAYPFHCESRIGREEADLWMFLGDSHELRVSSITPTRLRELPFGQYNLILNEFSEKFAVPAAEEMGLQAIVSKADVTIRDLLPQDVARALEDFSKRANKSSAAAHPSDRRWWEAFVIGAHRAHSELDATTLERWLIEEAGWPVKVAEDLAVQYEEGRSLLEENERQLQDA